MVDKEPHVDHDPRDQLAGAAALLDQLAGTLTARDDLPDYLDRLCASVSRSVPGCDAVGVTAVLDGRPQTAAYTTVSTLEIDALQYAVGDGPCLEAFRTGREVLADLHEALDRWPHFAAEAARQDGIRSLFALPLASGGCTLGALNLYAHAPGAFDDVDATLLRMAASRAADAIASVALLIGARTLAEQLETAMASRAVIEQAKGVIMGRQGVDETTAFDLLRQQSQHTNTKLRDVAAELVNTAVAGARQAG